jgi:hypothetical protein
MSEKIKIDSIEDAIHEIKHGRVIIVVDDEDRENEGDFICAGRIDYPGDCKLYGYPWARTHLRTPHGRSMRRIGSRPDGRKKYGCF